MISESGERCSTAPAASAAIANTVPYTVAAIARLPPPSKRPTRRVPFTSESMRTAAPRERPEGLSDRSADRPEGGPHLLAEDFRLLPGREVSALVDLVEVDDVGVARLDPAAWCPPDLARERREAERDRRGWQRLSARGGIGPVRLPVRPGRRRAGAGQPVERDVVEDLVAREVARGPPVDKGARDLAVGVRVVVDHPGGEGQRGVQQGVADRLRPGGHLDEVAVSGLPEGGDLRGCRPFLVGVRRHGAAERRHQQVGVDADQALEGKTAHRIRDAGAHVAALGDVAGVAETAHQLGPCTRRTTRSQPNSTGSPERPYPGRDGSTRWKASSPLPPCAVGSVSGPTESSSSITEPGHPWVMISGSAFSCADVTWMKWISTPSISVTNCGRSFSRPSTRPKSYSSSQ